jgi:hypothetical protein
MSYRAAGLFYMNSSVQEAAAKEGGVPHFVPIAMPPRRASQECSDQMENASTVATSHNDSTARLRPWSASC